MNVTRTLLPAGLAVLTLSLLLTAQVRADEVLWKSGKNLYIKLTEQDKTASGEQPPPNDQPVELDANAVTNALNLMQIWNENYIRTNEAIKVFSTSQARLLGEYIARGLRQAGPDEDIVFALARRERGFLSIETVQYMSGRAFYVDGKLNLIIGDYNRPADRFKERALKSHGMTGGVQYYFDHGKRAKSVGFDERVIGKDGIRTYQGRSDWFLLDVNLASRTYLAEQREQQREQVSPTGADSEVLQREAAKLARERREMRLEMARMRKELEQARQGGDLDVEERLKRLESLKEQGLISEEEYSRKRQEILDEL